MTTPERPRLGRGSWPKDGRGGTLAASGSGFGRYYGHGAGEKVPEGTTDADRQGVKGAIKAIQRALNWHVATPTPVKTDGVYGATTTAAVVVFQNEKQPTINRDMQLVDVDRSPKGFVGKETSYALFMPIADRYAIKWRVPRGLLRGLTALESNWDPGAVGYWTDSDFGLCQWNTTLPGISRDNALDPFWALDSSAKAMRERYDSDRWGHSWLYVLAAHNAPTWAAEWAQGKLSAANPADKPKLDRLTGYTNALLGRSW